MAKKKSTLKVRVAGNIIAGDLATLGTPGGDKLLSFPAPVDLLPGDILHLDREGGIDRIRRHNRTVFRRGQNQPPLPRAE